MAFVSDQLGRVGTTKVEKYYGHLSESAMTASIRKLAPVLKISKPTVKPLKIGKKRA
jgi:hypothetical protein